MISEMSCIAAVGELWGLHRVASTAAATTLIVSVVVCCSYRQIEKIGVLIGLFELTFVVSMVMLMPSLKTIIKGSTVTHTDPEFIKLIAANMGAAIMPWMIFFQQSAVVARGMRTSADLEEERGQTALGCALTQLIMIGTLVSVAAAHTFKGSDLRSVQDIVSALIPALGANTSKILVSLGFLGGSLCASVVVALAASWAICEALRMDDQQAGALDRGPSTGVFPSWWALAQLFS
jgi:Mn2+/Fe2+ NRAMP family transporter